MELRGFVNHFRTHLLCAICGGEPLSAEPSYLLAENAWEDKLIILRWSEAVASRPGVQVACCIDHVEELVVHWMTHGGLDYPVARTGPREMPRFDVAGARQLGELAVHRESLERVLAENPQSLQEIMDALLDALRRDSEAQAEAVPLREKSSRVAKELCSASTKP